MRRCYRIFLVCVSVLFVSIGMMAQTGRTFGSSAGLSNYNPWGFDKARPVAAQQAGTEVQAPLADDEPLVLYGALVQRNSWNDQGVGRYGMYSFNVTSEQSELDITPLFLDDRMISTNSGVYVDGIYYLYYAQTYYGLYQRITLLALDADTGEVLSEVDIPNPAKEKMPFSLTYDPVSKEVYGYVQCNVATDTGYEMQNLLVTLDMETGEVKKEVGRLPDDVFFVMQFNETGILYGINNRGYLYTINPATAECTEVGNTKYQPLFNQSGAIDQRSNRMYWAYYTNRSGKLLEVDLATATTTEIVSFPDGENFIGLHSRTALADDQAPAIPQDLVVNYDAAGSMSATLEATAPVETFDGGTLSQDVDLVFLVDEQEVGRATGIAPGAKGDYNHTFAKEGVYRVSVMAVIGDDQSPKLTVSTYAGYDTPQPVTGAELVLDDEDNGNYTLTWEAPVSVGVNNGLVDLDNMTYRIIEYPAQRVVEEDWDGTTYTGRFTGQGLQNYSFGIVAKSQGKESTVTRSNSVQYGGAISAPYTEDFNTDLTWELYKVVDANHDGYTWTWADGRAAYQGMECPNQASDWLFTPAVKMRKDITYSIYVTFDGGYWQTESFKIVASPGTDLTNPGMEVLYDKTQEFNYGQVQGDFTAPEDGEYYFGFQCYSGAGIRGIQIDSYSIVASEAPDAPANATDFTVTPAELGAFSATLSLTAPTTTVEGEPLSEGDITSISIYRRGEFVPIHTFHDPAPGEELTYVDDEAIHGVNYYNAVSYGPTGNSGGVEAESWVGEDYASAPLNFEAVVNRDDMTVDFSWERPSGGLHGGYINWETTTYTIQFLIPELTESILDIAAGITELSYTDSDVMRTFLEMSDQYDIIFIVSAVTSAGMGQYATADSSTGDAYGLPYWESFSNGYLTTAPWTILSDQETSADTWLLTTDDTTPFGVMSYDNDGGAAMCYQPEMDADCRLIGPRIDLAGTTEPILRFYMYHDVSVSENNYLQMEVRYETSDKSDFVAIGEPILVNNGKYGWLMHELPLSDLIEDGEFRLTFHGYVEAGVDFYVDNIAIREKTEWGYPTVNDLRGEAVDGQGVRLTWSQPSFGESYTLEGYEVYVDEQLDNAELVTGTEYMVDVLDGTEHTFYVIAVYTDGKSEMSNVVELTAPSGIGESTLDNVVVTTGEGCIMVYVADGEADVTVSTVDGRIVNQGNVAGTANVAVEDGVYIVNVDGNIYKVMVR